MIMKAITVMAGFAMVGATATAGMYPEPFTSNTAIVVGANAALSDNAAAAKIASNLDSVSASTGGSVTLDGEMYQFDKSGNHFNLGDNVTDLRGTIDDDELPVTLADLTYTDTNNDEFEATQKIVVGSGDALQLNMFSDNDYMDGEPTLGFYVGSGQTVATYTLDFSDQPAFANLNNTEFPLMGKEYYVLSTTSTSKITLLDSAEDTILSEGSSTTLTAGGTAYTVEIVHIASNEVILSINGEQTKSLGEGDTYKLDSGAYVGLKDILYSAKDTGISKVEFSIGNGKLILESGSEVELNEDTINGLTSTFTVSSGNLDKIVLTWVTDDEEFITTEQALVMPGFETFKFVFGGVNYEYEEEIKVELGSDEHIELADFPLKGSVESIPLIYTDTVNYTGLGKDSTHRLITGTTTLSFDADTDDMFIASYASSTEAESYVVRAASFKIENSVNKTTIQYKKDGSWVDAISDGQVGDTFDIGSAELNITSIDKLGKVAGIQALGGSTTFDALYSETGLKVALPTTAVVNSTYGSLTYPLVFTERDKDGAVANGKTITVTLGLESDGDVDVTAYASSGVLAGAAEIGETDVWRDFVQSDLATEILHNKPSGSANDLKLIYHATEVTADVYIAATGATTTTTSGVKTYTDSNVASAAGMNLVVVGGSAINSVAADLLGGSFREAEFTAATGVGAGEFLIQSFDRSGNTALLVAGYNAADTDKAVTYLLNKDVDTTVGMKYKGTSSTEASLVTA